jgi:hypothetical protein
VAGIERARDPSRRRPGKVAFLFTGQGSQYANMLAGLRRREPVVSELFEQADEIMLPLLEGRCLSDVVFADPANPEATRAEQELRRTEIQQPAVITVDIALMRRQEMLSSGCLSLWPRRPGIRRSFGHRRMALPILVDRITRFADGERRGRLWAVVSPHEGRVDAEVVDETGRVRVRLEGYRTSELPGQMEDAALDPIRSAIRAG